MEQQSTGLIVPKLPLLCLVRLTNLALCRAEQQQQNIIVTFCASYHSHNCDSVILQTPAMRLKVILDAGFKVLMGWILVMRVCVEGEGLFDFMWWYPWSVRE